MFSHKIHHLKKKKLVISENDFIIIPFGQRCSSAMACIYANLRKFSLPFDWTIPLYPKNIKYVLKNKFENFIPDVYNDNYKNIYNFRVAHFNSNKKQGIEQYNRRIQRFNDIMMEKNKIIYFIYLNDDYLINENCRNKDFNNNMFNELLNLELYIKQLYPHLKFQILYFDFVYHKIPKNYNIIQIELKSDKYVNVRKDIEYTLKSFSQEEINRKYLERYCLKKLRLYVAKILSKIFHTKYDKTIKFKSD